MMLTKISGRFRRHPQVELLLKLGPIVLDQSVFLNSITSGKHRRTQ